MVIRRSVQSTKPVSSRVVQNLSVASVRYSLAFQGLTRLGSTTKLGAGKCEVICDLPVSISCCSSHSWLHFASRNSCFLCWPRRWVRRCHRRTTIQIHFHQWQPYVYYSIDLWTIIIIIIIIMKACIALRSAWNAFTALNIWLMTD